MWSRRPVGRQDGQRRRDGAEQHAVRARVRVRTRRAGEWRGPDTSLTDQTGDIVDTSCCWSRRGLPRFLLRWCSPPALAPAGAPGAAAPAVCAHPIADAACVLRQCARSTLRPNAAVADPAAASARAAPPDLPADVAAT